METTLLNLPWQIQLSLASGYAAYLMANAGNREHHQPVDVAFSTLLFGLFATLIYNTQLGWGIEGYLPIISAFIGTLLVGSVWRKFGRPVSSALLRAAGISISNDDPTALATLFSNTGFDVTQISVRMDDGRWLHCADTRRFADSPHGPCVIGPAGDVAVYLTDMHGTDGALKPVEDGRDTNHGDLLTYIPASRVSQINLRFKSRPSRLGGVVAAAVTSPQGWLLGRSGGDSSSA